MGRNRVLSFMSQFSAGNKTPSPPLDSASTNDSGYSSLKSKPIETVTSQHTDFRRPITPPSHQDYGTPVNSPPRSSPPQSRSRSNSRPLSMMQTYQPSVMEVNDDTIPELQPIFSFLNSQSNRLYHEGYFLKLDDQNTQGKLNADRSWTECFAQLVGTVLSLWDAAELDAAGDHGEVLPKFINLTDASIKMIDSLPTRSQDELPLQNILSLSTAGRNRYLLHFNSHHSLVEWTAAIRLAMYEHATLQEAYTGALIAGKGKTLNNINIIMERSRFQVGEWVRVRFGAGVPWRRCWCVISPPDEKEYAKMQKEMKKRSAYDRSHAPILKGDIKFYDNKIEGKKQKKVQPIASISDAFSAYAVYPQSKSLIDASTLIKIEGDVNIYTDPPSSSEGFVFVMPETRPMVSGFETMMRLLFPTWDTFGLYGRPGRLVASVLDSRSLMFAMPKSKRFGYLDLQDVVGLLQTNGSSAWKERDWHKQLKDATGVRMNSGEEAVHTHSRTHSRSASRASCRLSFGASHGSGRSRVGFAGDDDVSRHMRSSSESNSSPERRYSPRNNQVQFDAGRPKASSLESISDEDQETTPSPTLGPVEIMGASHTPEPVSTPPAFNHSSQDRPSTKPYHSPELRQANSRLSKNTLAQMANAGGISLPKGPSPLGVYSSSIPTDGPTVPPHTTPLGPFANDNLNRSREVLTPPEPTQLVNDRPSSSQSYQSRHSHRSHHSNNRPVSTYANALPISTYNQGPHEQQFGPPSPRPLPNIPQPTSGPQDFSQEGLQPPIFNEGTSSDFYPLYRPYSGPAGAPGSPTHPQRKPLPMRPATSDNKHESLKPIDIIDHYTSQTREQYDRATTHSFNYQQDMPPQPPPHQQVNDYQNQQFFNNPEPPRQSIERPRAGVLKTVGGVNPEDETIDLGIPSIDFGPTINYGAPAIFRKKVPERHDARPQTSHVRTESKSTMAWQPASPPRASQSSGLSAEQYVQQRAAVAAAPAQYGHMRKVSGNTLGGRSPSPGMNYARPITPQSNFNTYYGQTPSPNQYRY